jgi:large subunit ribosomal protein L29
MKASDVHNLKDPELIERLRQAKEEHFGLRFQHATGELENTSSMGAARRDIARLLTVAKERGIDVEKELSD